MPAAAAAAEALATVRVFTEPEGVSFTVDGKFYTGATTFAWPAGSKHIIFTNSEPGGPSIGKRYVFQRWIANNTPVEPSSAQITFTADPAISSLRAQFVIEYALYLRFNRCETPCTFSPGTIFVERAPFTQDADIWFRAGSLVALQASPSPGYVFVEWIEAEGTTRQGFLNTIMMNGARWAYPRFEVARRVNLATSPPGLQLLADRAAVVTPATMEWGWNTTHTLAPVTPQNDLHGKTWIFTGWSDMAGSVRAYKVAPLLSQDTITANFVPGARLTFLTNPPNLKLRVDGRDNWTGAYSYSWGVGETHRVEAPAEQVGADGRKYVFRGWSNGSAAAHDVTVTDAHVESGFRVTATYEILGRITIQSQLANLVVRVDGQECPLPCTLDRPVGANVRVAAPGAIAAGENSRWEFQGWGDVATPERTVTLPAEIVLLRASYKLLNRLVTAAEPPTGARWRLEPPSPDGFYDEQASVAVTAEPAPGFRFRRMEGDLAGPVNTGTLRMSSPRTVLAVFERAPYLPTTAVANAAGEIPTAGVAPGSVISIAGLNLTDRTETGPESPLAQTLGGLIVRLDDRLLPLYSVSPEQIKAHLPYDVEPGSHTLAVRNGNQPEVKTVIEVVRNAPGLFPAAAREDGSPVSETNPALPGETITLFGTGFGPYQAMPVVGFAIPPAPRYLLVDPVEVLLGEEVVQPVSAAALPGAIGIDAIRITLPGTLAGPAVPVTGRSNGLPTNTLSLPVGPR